MSSTLSVRDVCERYGVSEHTVSGWIHSGSLAAFSVSRKAGAKKPSRRVTQEALTAAEQQRAHTPPQPRAKRRKGSADVIELYK